MAGSAKRLSAPSRAALWRRSGAPDVTFIAAQSQLHAASFSLRVHQMAGLLGISRPNLRVAVRLVASSPRERRVATASRLVIVTKSGLQKIGAAQAEGMAERSTVVLDPVDGIIPEYWAGLAKGVLAPSHHAIADIQRLIPGAVVRHVPHHVDLRVPEIEAQRDTFSLAYFGEPANAMHLETLQKWIRTVPTTTNDARDVNWHRQLGAFSAHYAIRPADERRIWKPPTKLAIAAHVGANVIALRSEPDYEYHLGSDYPYLAADDSLAETLSVLARAEATFGTPTWEDALDAVRIARKRFTPHAVCEALGSATDDYLSL